MKATKKQIIQDINQAEDKKISWVKDLRDLSIAELIEKYAYAEAIVETVREPLVILGGDLRIKTVNKSFLDTFKTTKEETYGEYLYDLNSGEWDIPALRKLLGEILPQNTVFNNFEVTYDFTRIGRKTMLLNARRIILDENNTELILLAIEDVTQRKILEQQKEDFINIASHELKTPLTSIKSYLHIMQKRLKESGNQKDKEILEILINQTEVLTATANRLLESGRIQENKKKKTNLHELIEKVVKELKPIQGNTTISIVGASKTEIFIDEIGIKQVLVNLLTNAVKYSPPRGKITIRISKQKGEVVVSVQDTGIGIAKEDIIKVFARYYRTGETNVEGYGLGLYISKQIVLQQGGRIWVESERGKGATFYFTLPLKD